MYKKLFVIIAACVFSFATVSAQTADVSSDMQNAARDLSDDGTVRVGRIHLNGVKLSQPRFDKELPVHEGDVWDADTLEKVTAFLAALQKDNVIESGNYSVVPMITDHVADITITVAEKLPLFAFAFPFYSTSKGFKIKLKYWNFYHNGYPLPIEAQVEYIAKEKLDFSVYSNEPLRLNDNVKLSFDIDAYTSTFNYMSTDANWHYDTWESGIKDLSASLDIKIPRTATYLQPYVGMGYGNVITTDDPYQIDNIVSQNHVTLLNPTLQVKQPIDSKGSYVRSYLGYGYTNYYTSISDASGDTVSTKNEFSLSLIGNDPEDIKNPLDRPVRLTEVGIALDKINSFMYLNLDVAVMQTLSKTTSTSGVEYTFDDVFLKEFSYSKFEDDVLKKIDDADQRAFVKSCYYKDTDDKKYYINKGTSNAIKQEIWDILKTSGIVYNNGFLVGPSIKFDFAVGKTGLHILPGTSFTWNIKYEDPQVRNQTVAAGMSLAARYTVPYLGLVLKFNSGVTYSHEWWDNEITGTYHDDITDKVVINEIMLSAQKFFPLSQFYLRRQFVNADLCPKAGHDVTAKFRLEADPVWRMQDGAETSTVETTLEVVYSLYLPVYKSHKFKFRGLLFASFNKVTDEAFDDDLIGDWVRGKGFGSLDSYAGVVLNFDYWIPLFVVDTNAFVGKTMKKPMMWDIYWVLYTDVMVSVTNEETDYTLDKNLLHLLPAMTVGTAFRFYPKFLPLAINVEASLNVYNMVKDRGSIKSYLYFEFSISHQLGSNWFFK